MSFYFYASIEQCSPETYFAWTTVHLTFFIYFSPLCRVNLVCASSVRPSFGLHLSPSSSQVGPSCCLVGSSRFTDVKSACLLSKLSFHMQLSFAASSALSSRASNHTWLCHLLFGFPRQVRRQQRGKEPLSSDQKSLGSHHFAHTDGDVFPLVGKFSVWMHVSS